MKPAQLVPASAARLAAGRLLRQMAPRSAHGDWRPAGRDVIALIEQSNRGRIAALLPIRYGRMLQSPFAFLRGAASVMAFDLAGTPVSGLLVQASGDCHLMNFGQFGTPERNLIFDLNDFDETLAGPWEWDIKRLAASVMVAARGRHFPESACLELVHATVASYRNRMAQLARMSPLQRWYARIDAQDLSGLPRASRRQRVGQDDGRQLDKLSTIVDGRRRIRDNPPLLYHPPRKRGFDAEMRAFFQHYRRTLPDERKVLLDQYELVDVAMKVVGVGSVGTRCAIALFMANGHDPLFLQFKEARPSVLEAYHGRSPYPHPGQRIVEGQRLMQSASDIFLGWARDPDSGIDYYIRQLRDMKSAIALDGIALPELRDYTGFCAWALARAHAKSGDPAAISGYLGTSDAFDLALGNFARAYADQTEADYASLKQAVASGRLAAQL
ncbi:uncharacterized protein (DUF2252 family) [Oxalobacteraceae bacterium GrIS 1.11]